MHIYNKILTFLGIKQATNAGQGTDEDNYTVLLILTDGVITDLQ
jgi:hypothetical protein